MPPRFIRWSFVPSIGNAKRTPRADSRCARNLGIVSKSSQGYSSPTDSKRKVRVDSRGIVSEVLLGPAQMQALSVSRGYQGVDNTLAVLTSSGGPGGSPIAPSLAGLLNVPVVSAKRRVLKESSLSSRQSGAVVSVRPPVDCTSHFVEDFPVLVVCGSSPLLQQYDLKM
ncbi:hypothetical protein BaRGS_00022960 [Batillaria attramentaria]|uniref:Uncharacterized protein n=1 Tax=Batillaria attramentaria TaxID=370345 RepID=A0ABD0KF44_9CAEN